MAEEFREFGPADNQGFYRQCLRTDILFDTLFMSAVDIHPFIGEYVDPMVPTMAYLSWYGRSLVVNPNKPVNRTNVLVGSWADMMGPFIARDKIAERDAAGVILIESVRALLEDNVRNMIGDAAIAGYIDPIVGGTEDEWNHFRAGAGVQLTPVVAMKILGYLASRAGQAFRVGGVSMIVHVYVSTLKRGTVSEAFCDKITLGMQTDLQLADVRINPDACRTFFSVFGVGVTDTTIERVTTFWGRLLPESALRLRLTVLQATGSGLTALSVTGRAIKVYTDFNWARVQRMYPDEWAAFKTAVAAVGNNVWYGFRKELGVVSSTKYKNLTYVAKELLIKVNGEASLRQYGGWTRRAKYQATVDELIADYERHKTASILADEAPENWSMRVSEFTIYEIY